MQVPKYVFRDGVPVVGFLRKEEANPQKLGEAFDKARKEAQKSGQDVRALIEEQARSKRHPYHKHLEWDDEVCGVKYRMEQIAGIGGLIAIVDEESQEELPAFISVTTSKAPRQFYMPQEISGSKDLQQAALAQAIRDLEAFERRFRWMADVCRDVAEIRRRMEERRHELMDSPSTRTRYQPDDRPSL
jgi:hypothetical protein